MRKLSIRRRLLYGLLASSVLFIGGEKVARQSLGPPPPSGVLARISACQIVVSGESAALDCEPGGQSDVRFPTRPTRGVPRVVFLGGSSVREPHIGGGKVNFPSMLKSRLEGVELVNLGVPGMQAANVAVLSSQLAAISPDLVVIYSGHNDYNNDVFLGKVGGVKLWMIPVYRWMAKSWAYAALSRGTRPTALQQRARGGLIGTTDTLALEVRASVDARLESDLSLAVEKSPAPVLLATLLRNADDRPAGVLVSDRPQCEAALPYLGPDGSSARGKSERAQRDCPDTSISAWWASVALRAEGRTAEAASAWYASLALDPVPLRAPASADTVIRTVAASTHATLIDLEQILGPMPPRSLFVDTLHLSPAGAAAVADVLAPVIRTALDKP